MAETFINSNETNEEKKTWDMILYSFFFSQGNRMLHMLITEYLILNDLWVPHPDLFVEGDENSLRSVVSNKITQYVNALGEKGRHIPLETSEELTLKDYDGETKAYIDATVFEFVERRNAYKSKWLGKWRLNSQKKFNRFMLMNGAIARDRKYIDENVPEGMTYQAGRPIADGERGRDKWASFVIDFCVLKKGDGIYKWDNIPEEYKILWEDMAKEMKKGIARKKHPYKSMQSLARAYLEKHPNISERDKEKIKEFARL